MNCLMTVFIFLVTLFFVKQPIYGYGLSFSSEKSAKLFGFPEKFQNLFERYYDPHDSFSDPQLYSVSSKYGNSVIPMNKLPIRSVVVEAEHRPWSSWWYPKKEKTIFQNSNPNQLSPLEKYDRYLRYKGYSIGRNQKSAVDYEENQFNPFVKTWEGLCDAWAIASISENEPQHSRIFQLSRSPNSKILEFTPGDLKALLLKIYESVDDRELEIYGQKFTGTYDGWIYPDIFPDQFHRFIEVELFKNKRAFMMDHDASEQIWNVPVFKANYIIEAVDSDPNAVFVRMWLVSAESWSKEDLEKLGTKEAIREYNYKLYGTRDRNGNLHVEGGEWVKGPSGIDSRVDHPDYLVKIPEKSQITRRSSNPYIDPIIVDDILNLPIISR